MDIGRIKAESAGKWAGIFNAIGIDIGEGKHKPCPACGGKDRFRFTNRDQMGGYICNQCGAGDGFSLIQKVQGVDFIGAVKKVSEVIGVIEDDFKVQKPKTDPSKMLNKVWGSSHHLSGDDPVSQYLESRGLRQNPSDIKFCPSCYESDTKKNYVAMVAKIRNKEGKPISLHRTYLEGIKKANIESPKKVMTPTESLKGSAIRLMPIEGDTMGVAEGIETALSASQLFNVPVWAVVSSVLMESWEPPEEIQKITIFGDNDVNFVGQKSAYALANKLYLVGRALYLGSRAKGFKIDVQIPPEFGDWNDVLIKES